MLIAFLSGVLGGAVVTLIAPRVVRVARVALAPVVQTVTFPFTGPAKLASASAMIAALKEEIERLHTGYRSRIADVTARAERAERTYAAEAERFAVRSGATLEEYLNSSGATS